MRKQRTISLQIYQAAGLSKINKTDDWIRHSFAHVLTTVPSLLTPIDTQLCTHLQAGRHSGEQPLPSLVLEHMNTRRHSQR